MYSSILVGVDVDEPGSYEKSISAALALASCFEAEVALAYVVPEHVLVLQAQWSSPSVRSIMDQARTRLMTIAREHCGGRQVQELVSTGAVYAGLIEAGEKIEADLIVLSSHRPEMKDYLLGANASRVVRHAKCSVMIVRG